MSKVIWGCRNDSWSQKKISKGFSFIFLVCLLVSFSGSSFAEEKVEVIYGAGPSTKVVEKFVTYLPKHKAAQGYTFAVPEKSTKHAGGIQNTEKYIFGRTGRPLNDKEKAGGVEEIFLAKMPIAFIVRSETGVESLSLDQVCGVFTGKYKNWKEVGGNDKDIVVFTREPTEALFLTLKKDVPCMNEVIDTKYIFKKDDHLIEMFKTQDLAKAAIGFGAARNFPKHITVSGLDSGVNLGLVYKNSNRDHPLVGAAKEVARSEEWKGTVEGMGLGWPY